MSYKSIVQKVIPILAGAGMPVKYIQHVVENYGLGQASSTEPNHTDTLWNNVNLKKAVWSSLATLNPKMNKAHQPEAVGTLYHEFAHAYFDKKEHQADIKQMFSKASPYYRNTQLKLEVANKIITATKPKDVAEEAAAGYVDVRTRAYWQAYQWLHSLLRQSAQQLNKEDTLYHIARYLYITEQNFQRSMRERVFGYEWYGKDHALSSKPIPPGLKNFCDTVLLENKISDFFVSNLVLDKMAQKVRARLAANGLVECLACRDGYRLEPYLLRRGQNPWAQPRFGTRSNKGYK